MRKFALKSSGWLLRAWVYFLALKHTHMAAIPRNSHGGLSLSLWHGISHHPSLPPSSSSVENSAMARYGIGRTSEILQL